MKFYSYFFLIVIFLIFFVLRPALSKSDFLSNFKLEDKIDNEIIKIITLKQSLNFALEKNLDIKKSKGYRNLFKGRYLEEQSAIFPSLSVSCGLYHNYNDNLRASMKSLFSINKSSYYEGGVVLRQVLFTWGQVNSALRGVESGMLSVEDQIRFYRQLILRDVYSTFYDVLLAKEMAVIFQQILDQKMRYLDKIQQQIFFGVSKDSELFAADLAVRMCRPDVNRALNQIFITREKLGFLIGCDGRNFDISGSLWVDFVPIPSYQDLLTVALERRPDLIELKHRRGILKELINVFLANNKPRVDLQVEYGWYGGIQDQSVKYDGASGIAGVFFNYPIFDGLRTKGKVLQVRSEETNLKFEEDKLRAAIALQVSSALNELEEARGLVETLQAVEIQTERLLFIIQKGFECGIKTSLDVNDARVNLMIDRGNLAKARRNYLVAQVNLQWVCGVLGDY